MVSFNETLTMTSEERKIKEANPFDMAFTSVSSSTEFPLTGASPSLESLGRDSDRLDGGCLPTSSTSLPTRLTRKRAFSSPAVFTPGGNFTKPNEGLSEFGRARLMSMSDVDGFNLHLGHLACTTISSSPSHSSALEVNGNDEIKASEDATKLDFWSKIPPEASAKYSKNPLSMFPTPYPSDFALSHGSLSSPHHSKGKEADPVDPTRTISSIELLNQHFHRHYGLMMPRDVTTGTIDPKAIQNNHEHGVQTGSNSAPYPSQGVHTDSNSTYDHPTTESTFFSEYSPSAAPPADAESLTPLVLATSPDAITVREWESPGARGSSSETVQEKLANAKRDGTLTYRQFGWNPETKVGSTVSPGKLNKTNRGLKGTRRGMPLQSTVEGQKSPTVQPAVTTKSRSSSSSISSVSVAGKSIRDSSDTTLSRGSVSTDATESEANSKLRARRGSLQLKNLAKSRNTEDQMLASRSLESTSTTSTGRLATSDEISHNKNPKGKQVAISTEELDRDVSTEDASAGAKGDSDFIDSERARKEALGRNRIAATKSRLKKKDTVLNLESDAKRYCKENHELQTVALQLYAEVVGLRNFLADHVSLQTCCQCRASDMYFEKFRHGGREENAIFLSELTKKTLTRDYTMFPAMGIETDCFTAMDGDGRLYASRISHDDSENSSDSWRRDLVAFFHSSVSSASAVGSMGRRDDTPPVRPIFKEKVAEILESNARRTKGLPLGLPIPIKRRKH